MTKRAGLFATVLLFSLLFFSGCDLLTVEESPSASSEASPWQAYSTGIDYRVMPVRLGNTEFDMQIVRIDPNAVRWQVNYTPGVARNYVEWRSLLGDDVKAFINASFFTEANIALGMVVTNGAVNGQTLNGYGGMFQVNNGGVVRVRSLVAEPVNFRDTDFRYAVQSFPMLIEPGGVLASTGAGFDDPARRSVIAQATDGSIYMISTGLLGQISFRNLQNWLLNSDLEIDVAFALDGGRSAMLFVNGDTPIEVPGLASVPVILAVY